MATKTTVRKERVSRVKKGEPTHPGFKSVEAKIAKQKGVKDAGAILAAKTRAASPAAKAKNPKLKNVKMPKKSK